MATTQAPRGNTVGRPIIELEGVGTARAKYLR
jgi:hypothetical protein